MGTRVVDRRSVVQGMMQIDGRAIGADVYEMAPFFTVPFEMTDKTGLTQDMQKCLWSLYYVQCVAQQSILPAYMDGQGQLRIIREPKCKPVVVSKASEDSEELPLSEIDIQLRIVRAEGKKDPSKFVNVVVILAISPMAFSLVHAVRASLLPSAKDARELDDRRICWNYLRNHMRFGLQDSSEASAMKATICGLSTDIDWMCMPGHFAELFSIHSSIEWVRRLFFQKFPRVKRMVINGFGEFKRDVSVIPDDLRERYVEQGVRVNSNLVNMYARNGGKKRSKSADEDGNEDGAIEQVPNIEEWLLSDNDLQLAEPWSTGFPSVDYAVRVSVPLSVQTLRTRKQFCDNIKPYPANISVLMLGAGIGVRLDDEEEADMISPDDAVRIINGQKLLSNRATLGGGDVRWGEMYLRCIKRFPAEARVCELKKFVRLAFALTETRASGSDHYHCSRVEASARFMSSERESVAECASVWGAFVKHVGGCGIVSAARYVDGVLKMMNQCEWAFRSGNLMLFVELMITDVMLGLNFYNSVIRAAPNGIGPTLMIRDGGGALRRLVKTNSLWSIVMIYGKVNGSGVDFVINSLKRITSLKEYVDEDRAGKDPWVVLGSTSEQGLRRKTCNIKEEEPGKDPVITHTVDEMGERLLSSEFNAQNTSSGVNCIQAVSQLVRRNTVSDNLTTYTSTRETQTGQRAQVTYEQKCDGFVLISVNDPPDGPVHERLRTISSVSRSIPSCAQSLPRVSEVRGASRTGAAGNSNGIMSYDVTDGVLTSEEKKAVQRPLFFACMAVDRMAAMMQWTGSIGQSQETSQVAESILKVAYAQLELSSALLNPDMHAPGEIGRNQQISKARGVAFSHLLSSIDATAEAGRKGKGMADATCEKAMRMMYESLHPSVVPRIIADTMMHMMRTDFVILAQMLCCKFKVPTLTLDAMRTMLKDGVGPDAAMEWLNDALNKRETIFGLDTPLRLVPMRHNAYISSTDLRVVLSDNSRSYADMMYDASTKLGSKLFNDYSKPLEDYCQISYGRGGESIVQAMVYNNSNYAFQWPTIFGVGEEMGKFWDVGDPFTDETYKHNVDINSLDPIRIMKVERQTAQLFVNVWWLLLIASTAGTTPSQDSVTKIASRWVRDFYVRCVPNHMVADVSICTGIIGPHKGDGMMWPSIGESRRRTMRRPIGGGIIGSSCAVESGVVEDFAATEPRYMLAQKLGVSEADIETDDVSYSIPMVWTPALRQDCDPPVSVSIRINRSGRVLMLTQSDEVLDITAPDRQTGAGLRGRSSIPLRPLPLFDRPNVLLLDGSVYRVVVTYDAKTASYDCYPAANIAAHVMPSLVCRVRSVIAVRQDAIASDVVLVGADGVHLTIRATYILCTLAIMEEEDEEVQEWRGVRVSIPEAARHAPTHDGPRIAPTGRERTFVVPPEAVATASEAAVACRVLDAQ